MWKATGSLRNFLVLTLALFAATACVQADAARKRFDIAGQPAGAALNEFARQADITLIFSYDLIAGARTRPLKGDYTVGDGLTRLLAGTGLGYQQAGDDTFFICLPASCGTRSMPPATQAEQEADPGWRKTPPSPSP